VKGIPPGRTLPDRAYLIGRGYHELMDRDGEVYTLSGFGTTAGKGWIQVPGYERVRMEWPEGKEAHHLGEIALAPGRVLEISVADDEGAGVSEAGVVLEPGSSWCGTYDGVTNVRFQADGEGRLSLGGLWESHHSLRVSRNGFVTTDLSIDLESHSGVLEVVLAREACIRGRVLGPDGDPLLRARVVVPHGEQDHAGDLTDWTGAFLVRGVPAGRNLTGFLYFAGAAPTPFEIQPLGPGKPWDAGDLRMLPGEALAGTVIDDEGRPRAGETLFIELASEEKSPPPIIRLWEELPHLETDDAGRFELRGLLPGKYRLVIVHDDDSTQEKVVTVPTAAPVLFGPDDPEFQAHAGLVRDAGGAPVAGALVTVASRESRKDNFHEDARTRADGSFKIRNIPRDLVFPYLGVEHGLRSRTFLASSVSDLPGELVLERGCSIAIRVEMEEGDRDAGPPFLRLLREDGRKWGTVGPDESGAWIRAEDAPPGSYRGIVEARGHFPVEVEIEARLDRPFTAGVALRKFPPPRRYTLQVKSSKGVPMEGVEILSDLPGTDSRTDADGTAEILLIPGTEKGVRVRSNGHYPVRLDAADIGERRVVEVILHPNGAVRARVAIPGASADLEYRLELEPLEVSRREDASRDGAWSVTGPEEYVMADLPAGRYALVVASYSPEMESWVVARQEVTVIDGETVDAHIELPAHFQIRGAVTEAGTPLPGKRIYLSHVEDGSEYLLRAKLDLAGRFSRSACVAGKYALSIAIDGELRGLGEVKITGEADLSLELER
jgi:hypothetical protein